MRPTRLWRGCRSRSSLGSECDAGRRSGTFVAEDVVTPEGTVEVCPGLDGAFLVRGKDGFVVTLIEHIPEFAFERAEAQGRKFAASGGVAPFPIGMVYETLGD